MNTASFLGLIENVVLLLAAAFIFDLFASRWRTGGAIDVPTSAGWSCYRRNWHHHHADALDIYARYRI